MAPRMRQETRWIWAERLSNIALQEAVVVNCTSENVATSYINLLKEVAIAANEAIGVEAALCRRCAVFEPPDGRWDTR